MENNDPLSEHNESKNENLVEDLKKSLENTIDETKNILEDLERTVAYVGNLGFWKKFFYICRQCHFQCFYGYLKIFLGGISM